jgi:hypothetical protein
VRNQPALRNDLQNLRGVRKKGFFQNVNNCKRFRIKHIFSKNPSLEGLDKKNLYGIFSYQILTETLGRSLSLCVTNCLKEIAYVKGLEDLTEDAAKPAHREATGVCF